MAPTGIDQIEIKVGTYRAHLAIPATDIAAKLVKDYQYQATTKRGACDHFAHLPFAGAKPTETVGSAWFTRAARVVRGWKNARLFKGATFATRDAVTKEWKPTTLASLCAFFDVEAPKGAAPTEAPAEPAPQSPPPGAVPISTFATEAPAPKARKGFKVVIAGPIDAGTAAAATEAGIEIETPTEAPAETPAPAAPKARKALLCAYPGARVIVNCTRVPFWTLRDGAHCHGEAVQLPHGVPGEIIDGDADRPLIRATHPMKGDVFGWVLPGDFELACEAPAPAPEAPAAPASAIDPNPLSIFTLGFEDLSLARVAEIVSERKIDLIVDIRSKTQTITVAELRATFGKAYVTKGQLKGGLIAILPALKAQGSARVLFVREEEAPGDHYGTMEMGRLAMTAGLPMVHIFRSEEVTHAALQKAIDEDLATGGDHYYECEIELDAASEAATDDAKVRDRIAKLERRAADKGSSASEVETCRAEIERLKASIRKAA